MEFFAPFNEFYNIAKNRGEVKTPPVEKFEICQSQSVMEAIADLSRRLKTVDIVKRLFCLLDNGLRLQVLKWQKGLGVRSTNELLSQFELVTKD